jgi:hypothetical protein
MDVVRTLGFPSGLVIFNSGLVPRGRRPERGDDLDLQPFSEFSVFLDASGSLRVVGSQPSLQRLPRFGVVVTHIPKALIVMEAGPDRRCELRKALDHAFQPGVHAFPFNLAMSRAPSLS